MERKHKTIRLTIETYNELAKLGYLSKSFDDVVRKLLEHNKKKR